MTFWNTKSKPMTKFEVATKMGQAFDVAIALARGANVPADQIATELERRADSLRLHLAMTRPVL